MAWDSASCPGALHSNSMSAATSPAPSCPAVESTGRSHGCEDWDCERKRKLYLLETSRPDQRQPLKAGAFRASASRLAALTGCHRPGRRSSSSKPYWERRLLSQAMIVRSVLFC